MKLTDITRAEYTTYVGLLTVEQKDELVGQEYAPDSYFNPIQDNTDNWIISVEEMQNNINPMYTWVKDLELIVYVPKENPFPPVGEN
jgi:hypothetical protein